MVLVISLQNHFTPLPKSIHLSYVHFVPGKNISSQDQNFKLSQTQSATSLHIIICKKVKIKWWQNLKLKRLFREKKHVYSPFLFSKMVAKHICMALIILDVNSYLFGSLVVNTSFGLVWGKMTGDWAGYESNKHNCHRCWLLTMTFFSYHIRRTTNLVLANSHKSIDGSNQFFQTQAHTKRWYFVLALFLNTHITQYHKQGYLYIRKLF